jgi:hypothetical protein
MGGEEWMNERMSSPSLMASAETTAVRSATCAVRIQRAAMVEGWIGVTTHSVVSGIDSTPRGRAVEERARAQMAQQLRLSRCSRISGDVLQACVG